MQRFCVSCPRRFVIGSSVMAFFFVAGWPSAAQAQRDFLRGDSNGDGRIDISDAVFSLGFLFLGTAAPPCPDAADANDDGRIDISDASFTLGYLFLGTTAPPAPGPLVPGPDPSADGLGCDSPADVDNDTDGFTENQGDCNDANAAVHPGATEVCNGVDDDCNEQIDDPDVCDGGDIPPDPSTVAPPIDQSVATTLGAATEFLYTGADPIQTGVAAGTIDPRRAAVLRGKVLDRTSAPLPGAAITVLHHPEFGQTLSRADGMFDLAVNGGGLLTINYQKAGFLPSQRQVDASWQDYATAPDVMLLSLDPETTTIDLTGNLPMQVARGSRMTDADGSRQATLLFPQGAQAQMVMPDGSTQPINTLNVRATEYSVGPDGPKAMPAALPPTSAYTYAVELSADEAIAAGAKSVTFSQPLIHHVENFLGFPVGTAVPAGFYDRDRAAWVASDNGRVIKIAGVAGGLASVDTVGEGSLPPLVLGDAERQQLASLYPAGQELWRVPIPHFSPWDHNWPFLPPSDATAANQAPPQSDETVDQDAAEVCGSIIEPQNQILGESVPIVGTSFTLSYSSVRAPGRLAGNTLTIALSGSSIPASLKRIELTIQIAGRTFQQMFTAAPDQQTTFTWDGLDAYGRAVQGRQPVTGRIDYVYDAVYAQPGDFEAAFARFGSVPIERSTTRSEFTLVQQFRTGIGILDARPLGLGGWILSPHHVYDPVAQQLHTGNGRRRRAESIGAVMENVSVLNQDGTPAFARIHSVAVGPDGTVHVAGVSRSQTVVRRITPDGQVSPFGSVPTANTRQQLALGPDGSLYVSQESVGQGNRISRIAPDGTTTVVAGTDAIGVDGDEGPASLATFFSPVDVAVAADGSLYIADSQNPRIRRIGPDGIISTVAGSGDEGFSGDGGPATQASMLPPSSVAVGPDGSFYFTDVGNGRIRRVGPDGIITTVAGNGPGECGSSAPLPCGDGGPATQATLAVDGSQAKLTVGPDGTLYIADGVPSNRVRQIGTDGIIRTVAGRGGLEDPSVPFVDGMPAGQAPLVFDAFVGDVTVAPDGTLFIASGPDTLALDGALRRVLRSLPQLAATDLAVASEDGQFLYVFDSTGRHLRTLDVLTGAVLHELTYDTAGRLASVIEKTGGIDNVTTIEHDVDGNPAAIAGPFGQRTLLSVDGNGFLASITNPAGEVLQIGSTPTGLLTSHTNPRGKTSNYAYDAVGRLTGAADPAGGSQVFVRTDAANQYQISRTTGLSRTTVYKVEDLPTSVQKRTITAPDGTQRTTEEMIEAGTSTLTAPDGTITNTELGPDPRFGMQAPFTKSLSMDLPGGNSLTVSSSQSAIISNPSDPLSLVSLTDSSTIAGQTTTHTYTAATRTLTSTTPAGRTSAIALDSRGRLVSSQIAGLDATTLAYDSRGGLASITQGTGHTVRTTTFSYDPEGFLQSITDPIGRLVQFTHDAAGRIKTKTLPDGRVANFDYDAAGNLTSLTPPGRPAHDFEYSDRNEPTSVIPPNLPGTGATGYSHDVDRQPATLSRPGGRTVTLQYDSAGRPNARVLATNGTPTATDTVSYDSAGRLLTFEAASGLINSYTYDGPLSTGESWTGPITGSVTRAYDNRFRLAAQSINGANTIALAYDSDGLLIGVGNHTMARDPQSGLPTGSSLGVVSTSVGHNSFGETTSQVATAGGGSVYSVVHTRDGIGRIGAKTESILGSTDTYVYSYHASGQLTSVIKNGAAVEAYSYDDNGNRAGATVGGASIVALYDAQDRLTQYGATTYAYTAAGELLTRTTGTQITRYQYDQLGNLLGVTLPGGTAITYLVDGNGRRVIKNINGARVKGFLYSGALRPVAELDSAGALVSRFVHAGRNVPAYMIKGGTAFRIVTDQVGSVRLVMNSVTGAVVQRMDYDSFGNVLLDTNPGFQPFGFAGGLYDPDTGLVRFGARDYDSTVGRWTTKDPSWFRGSDTNLYRYCGNNPVNLVDRTGKAMTPPDGTDIEDIARAFEEAITKITRQLQEDPDTGKPAESAADFARRRNALASARRAAGGVRDAAKKVAGCAKAAADAADKGSKAVGEILGFLDVLKLAVESAVSGNEPTLEDYGEAYLGYPVELNFTSGSPGEV